MYRMWWHITVAGWISAALTVSPLLAAMQCRLCCGDRLAAVVEAESVPPCCAHHTKDACPQTANAESTPSCPSCPKCDAYRPIPATAGDSWTWMPPVLAVTLDKPLHTVISEFASVLNPGRVFVDRAMPPPRVLFCTWQK